MENKSKVLVTAGENKSALACVRALADRGITVHVSAHSRLAIARWSRKGSQTHTLPDPREDGRAFCKALVELQQRYHFHAILLVCDYEISAWLEHSHTLDSHDCVNEVIAIPGKESFRIARDKSMTIRAAISAGVACPATWFPEDHPLEEIARQVSYPLLVKPNVSEGARGITLVERPEDLQTTLREVEARWGPCHLQEYVPSGGAQYKADVVVDRNGKQHALFVCRKLRYYPVSGGSSTLIVSEHHAGIEDSVRRLVDQMDWYGFADFDFIVDPRDGEAKLMECNPRFPESLSVNIFAGADFPWLMYNLIRHGKVPEEPDWIEGRYARFLVGDILWFLGSRERWRADPGFFRFFDRNQTYYVERLSDPGPTLCYTIEVVQTLLSPRRMAYRFGRGLRQRAQNSSVDR
ncbi:ATP-grasp domain-containing protein [Ectothiorhodospira lacustris]|uniref:carboxylate--amine ligase n=1 Tax=Ectothiorhodospira lacustris TaxID=2899127 RepID=UPI001EE93844|nr:ATP-grasp domain-containing protein [Ectothiorhodospira lacustris]MCG5501305.1 ATP-grasp domain-containing protein [Ectothiorhodospira lacustris]